MEVEFSPRARKQLEGIELTDRRRICARVRAYAELPKAMHHDVVPMIGEPDTFRLRVGNWRIIFKVEGEVMTVVQAAHRREAYR